MLLSFHSHFPSYGGLLNNYGVLCRLQARAQALLQQLHETYEQIEQTETALESFKRLETQEDIAIDRRIEVNNDNNSQTSFRRSTLLRNFSFLFLNPQYSP